MSPELKELMLLLKVKPNNQLLPLLPALYQKAMNDQEPEQRLETFLSRLLGKMEIPTGVQNYYHQLIDDISTQDAPVCWQTIEGMLSELKKFEEIEYQFEKYKGELGKTPQRIERLLNYDPRFEYGILKYQSQASLGIRFQLNRSDLVRELEARGYKRDREITEYLEIVLREFYQMLSCLEELRETEAEANPWSIVLYAETDSYGTIEHLYGFQSISGIDGKDLRQFMLWQLPNLLMERVNLTGMDH